MEVDKLNITNKKKLRIVQICIFLLVIICLTSIILIKNNRNKDDKYMTIDEYYKSSFYKNFWKEEYLGKTVYLKDKVVKVETFQLPKMEYGIKNNKIYTVELGEPFEVETYTKVYFDSNITLNYYFIGDKTDNFLKGKIVTFNDTVREYTTISLGMNIRHTQSDYLRTLMGDYYFLISKGKFSPLNYTSEWSDNTTYRIKINIILDFPPTPINWKDVTVYNLDDTGYNIGENETINLFDEKNNLLTTFKTNGNKHNFNKEITKGQIIEIEFETKPKEINIVFYVVHKVYKGDIIFLSLFF